MTCQIRVAEYEDRTANGQKVDDDTLCILLETDPKLHSSCATDTLVLVGTETEILAFARRIQKICLRGAEDAATVPAGEGEEDDMERGRR